MNFDGHIIVVGDLGQLKAYRVSNVIGFDKQESMQVSHAQNHGTMKESTVVELIFDIDYIEAHGRISEKMSDKTGRLGKSVGESHNAEIERKSINLKNIGRDIASIIEKESPVQWHLAFPKATHNKLKEKLDSQTKKTLEKNISVDLTKVNKNRILSYFE